MKISQSTFHLIVYAILISQQYGCSSTRTYTFGQELKVTIAEGGCYVASAESLGTERGGYRVFKVIDLGKEQAYVNFYRDTFPQKPTTVKIDTLHPLNFHKNGNVFLGPIDMPGLIYNTRPQLISVDEITPYEKCLLVQNKRAKKGKSQTICDE